MNLYAIPLGLSLLAIWAWVILRKQPNRKDGHDDTDDLGADASIPGTVDLRHARARTDAAVRAEQVRAAMRVRLRDVRVGHRDGKASLDRWLLTGHWSDAAFSRDDITAAQRLKDHAQRCEPRKRA